MNGWTILLAVTVPPFLLAVLLATPLRRHVPWLSLLAPLPALALAVTGAGAAADTIDPLILDLRLGFDAVARVLLVQVAALWVLAGLHLIRARPFDGRFPLLCTLLTMAGSLGTTVALDMVSFYVFLSVLTVASYGLIDTGDGDPDKRRAARVYLSLALLGEFLALAAFLLAASGGGGLPYVWLLYFGVGAKLGVLPLHVALPLVYRAAPQVGAAVMGGVLLTSTAVGWLRFMPEAGEALATATPALLVAGLGAAFLGVLLGLLQRDARAALGYSTVSQMGLFTAFTAVAAAEPATWSVVLPMLALFLVHHGFNKGALLLAVGPGGAAAGALGLLVVAVSSLALAAAPATGGAIAKLWIEEEIGRLPGIWHDVAKQLLPYTSAATALLMARITWLAGRKCRPAPDMAVPAVLAVVGAFVLPWQIVTGVHHDAAHLVLSPGHLWKTTWPAALGIGVFLILLAASRAAGRWPLIPEGDVLAPVERAWRALAPQRAVHAFSRTMAGGRRVVLRRTRQQIARGFRRLRHAERGFRDLRIAGSAFAGLIVALVLVVVLGR